MRSQNLNSCSLKCDFFFYSYQYIQQEFIEFLDVPGDSSWRHSPCPESQVETRWQCYCMKNKRVSYFLHQIPEHEICSIYLITGGVFKTVIPSSFGIQAENSHRIRKSRWSCHPADPTADRRDGWQGPDSSVWAHTRIPMQNSNEITKWIISGSQLFRVKMENRQEKVLSHVVEWRGRTGGKWGCDQCY